MTTKFCDGQRNELVRAEAGAMWMGIKTLLPGHN
jgi:hypothetical protein